MSLEQLGALVERLKQDKMLMAKLKSARNIDDAEAIAKEAGFKVRKADWLKYQAQQTLELSPQELESVSGGGRARYVASQGIRGYCALEKAVHHGGLKEWAKQRRDASESTRGNSTPQP
jgi:predicted ribosomally synthesized peptide with nif11-like leader